MAQNASFPLGLDAPAYPNCHAAAAAASHDAYHVLLAAQQWPPYHPSFRRHSAAHAQRRALRPLPVMRVDALYPPSRERSSAHA